MSAQYAAVVPAGGFSSRMQELKPLLPLNGETVINHLIAAFQGCGVDVILVTGYRREDVEQSLKSRNITIAYNPDYGQGMFTSVQAGVKHLPPGSRAFFMLPADVPLVRPATVRRLIAAAESSPGRIIYPAIAGRRGHPPLIPAALAPVILGWRKEGGLKAVLDTLEKQAREIPVPDRFILRDMDTPEDYRALLADYRRAEIPTDDETAEIWRASALPQERINHSIAVAAAAEKIAGAFGEAGPGPDRELIRAASLLHDIAKGAPQHDIAGGKTLRELGFGRTADIVAVHSDLGEGWRETSLETQIVFIADKLVQGDKRVSLDYRYDPRNRPFAPTPEVATIIGERLKTAQAVKAALEARLGRTLEAVIG